VFGALMFNPVSKKDKSEQTAHENHLLSIITQLFLHTVDVRYLRVLRKFQEAEMVKTERTVELLVKYQTRVDEAEAKYKEEHGEEAKEEDQVPATGKRVNVSLPAPSLTSRPVSAVDVLADCLYASE
jgi:hypothetical protein